MSRVIKFRWWNGRVMIANENLGLLAKNLKNNKNGEIMQFTGLQDSAGVDIYEGDIVRFDVREDAKVDPINNQRGTVSIQPWGVALSVWSILCCEKITVLGNIHENPELMEAK